MLVVTSAFDVFGGDPITSGDVRVEAGRTGKPWADRVLGEAGTFPGRRDRHFVVDDGAGQLLVE
ncbi:MAG: hypothetical protein WBO08_00695 [Mycobacterium sp.]